MNRNITLAKRENEIAECVAWGGSYKETASLLQISVRTVDNTLRRIKEKLGLNKINEISAWWFCTHHDISLDLSPFVRPISFRKEDCRINTTHRISRR